MTTKKKITIEYLTGKHPAMSRTVAKHYIQYLRNSGIYYTDRYSIELIKGFKLKK